MGNGFVSIVVPIYNEARSVEETIVQLKQAMDNSDFKYEIIAVNDKSKDRSGEILEGLKGIRVVHHVVNKGYSASLKTGIKAAKGDWIAITDADGTYPVGDLPKLLEYIDRYDMVVGARVGKHVNIPLLRRPAKWFLNKIANYIAGRRIPDLNSGLRVFRKSLALEFWKLFPERFSFTITITMAALTNSYDVKYIPINYYKRQGKSTIHPIKDFAGFNRLLLKMMLFFKPLKVFVPLSAIIFVTGALILSLGIYFLNKLYDLTFIMFVLSAIQIFIFGLIAELIIKKR